MLEPDSRLLLTEAFRPPSGFYLDYAVVTTYSLDLFSLLSSVLHLSLLGGDLDSDQASLIAVLEALRRTTDRIRIFHQDGNILGPKRTFPLYSMLEPVLVPVNSPNGGVFHPKVWVLRFRRDEATTMRIVVLSRNLTGDRSWDVALVLEEGQDGIKAAKAGLADLVDWLAGFCPSAADRSRTAELAAELKSAKWMVPSDFTGVAFFGQGLGKNGWKITPSDRLVVISPFLTETAVRDLADSTSRADTLVSTEAALSALSRETLDRFRRVCVLRESAELEDGEDSAGTPESPGGLHAKIYIAQEGRDIRLALGSANATASGVGDRGNVELLTELVGRSSERMTIDYLLGERGIGNLLQDYEAPDIVQEPDPALVKAEEDLEAARRLLAASSLVLHCVPDGTAWRPELRASAPLPLSGIGSLEIWPVTGTEAQCVDGLGLRARNPVLLPPCGTAALTSLIAFRLTAQDIPRSITMVLSLPVQGMPEGRDKAIMREVLANAEGFLRYLRMLLSEQREDEIPSDPHDGHKNPGSGGWWGSAEGPLLEQMTRALVRDRDKLDVIERLVADLRSDEQSAKLLPNGFEAMWDSFAAVLEKTRK